MALIRYAINDNNDIYFEPKAISAFHVEKKHNYEIYLNISGHIHTIRCGTYNIQAEVIKDIKNLINNNYSLNSGLFHKD